MLESNSIYSTHEGSHGRLGCLKAVADDFDRALAFSLLIEPTQGFGVCVAYEERHFRPKTSAEVLRHFPEYFVSILRVVALICVPGGISEAITVRLLQAVSHEIGSWCFNHV